MHFTDLLIYLTVMCASGKLFSDNQSIERGCSTMQVQAIQGYFDRGNFYQKGRRVSLPERQLVIVNILDIPADSDELQKEDVEFWEEFDRLAKESADEELLLMDFPRFEFGRDPIIFEDEE